MTRYGDEIFPFGYAEVDLRRAERKRSIMTLEQPLTFLKVLAGKLPERRLRHLGCCV
jgi:hypothetical protein